MVAAKKNQKDSKGREGLARRASGLLSKPVTAVTTGALERALLAEFPAADAEPWDRTGMSVGDPARLITGVAVALDPTVEAIEAAANMGANVLVTHHPAFLAPPASFMPASSVAANPGAGVRRAVERGVSILSYHTALDVSVRAQRVLPGMLNLQFRSVEVPLASSKRKGYGQRCTVKAGDGPLTLGQLAARCTSVFARQPRVWGDFSRELERVVLLKNVDTKWMDHIDAMTELRNGIGLRAYGQHDPVVEYKREGFDMFDAMIDAIREDTVRMIFLAQVRTREEPKREQVAKETAAAGSSDGTTKPAPKRVGKKVGMNDPCPCGSGKKYKKCCYLKADNPYK